MLSHTGLYIAKQVNLDDLMQDFNTWQKYLYNVSQDNIHLQEDREQQKKTVTSLLQSNRINENELEEAKTMVKKLHDMLNKRCNLEDENRELKEKLKTSKEKCQDQFKCHQEAMDLLHAHLAEDDERHQTEKAEALKDLQKADFSKSKLLTSADEEKCYLLKTIEEKQKEKTLLEQKLCEAEKEKRAEVMRIQLEYDTKMLKLQKQSIHYQQPAQSVGTSQDIYRKKLQHVRVEYEREIASLRAKVADLQQQLAEQTKRAPNQQKQSTGSIAKRARRC